MDPIEPEVVAQTPTQECVKFTPAEPREALLHAQRRLGRWEGELCRAHRELTVAQQKELVQLAVLDIPSERDLHNRRVYAKARGMIEQLRIPADGDRRDLVACANALDTLDKVCRRCLGIGGDPAGAGGVNVAVLARTVQVG